MPVTAARFSRGEPSRVGSASWLWIWTGLLAVLLIIFAQAMDANGLLERGASWWRPFLTLPAHAVLMYSWWRLAPPALQGRSSGWRHPGWLAAIWSLPMLFALPMHSRDLYSYAAQGWLLNHGLDPYLVPSGQAGAPGLLVGVHWYKTTSVYPALAVQSFGTNSALFGDQVFWAAAGMRLQGVLALVLLGWCLVRLARRFDADPTLALWLGLANPVVLVQWIGGGHNDSVMVALLALAFVVATSEAASRWPAVVLAAVALGLAMSFKQSAALAGLGLVALTWQTQLAAGRRGWGRLAAIAVVQGAVTVAVFVATSMATGLGFGWNAETAGNPISATSNAPLSWVASFGRYHELADFPTVNAVVTAVGLALIVASLVWLYVRFGPRADEPGNPWAFVTLGLLAFGVLGPAFQPWYLTWLIPFYLFCGFAPRRDRAALLILIGFALLPALQDILPPYIAMEIVAVLLVPLWWHWRRTGFAPLETAV
ncbi:polyprenol phosphomannose-dependent alpha 1,6 mannosyltransferase MptB [Tessaracoccus caeni]|uniref:polyprenol phosphomannose-dependent alpha 1,6 mannosyltransferase MptB n=1 Tax=Tessaracoccus caeni TaxID=3031239 RepID=UPI0023DC0465|nr:polyprenol phosphomannose-dependent alpha 1,6 mannosyltransferase MptB [Tessaracoccus caeni]MDF1489275.1 polyprenol phosphomannose-dependent alpha 1,6 mannosyltransferase MptB [Tessaracoccus caeni]